MSRLSKVHDEPHGSIEERAAWWALLLSQIVMVNEDLFEALPDECNLIILPEGDPDLCTHNFLLAQKSKGPNVFIGIKQEEDCAFSVTPLQGAQTFSFAA